MPDDHIETRFKHLTFVNIHESRLWNLCERRPDQKLIFPSLSGGMWHANWIPG